MAENIWLSNYRERINNEKNAVYRHFQQYPEIYKASEMTRSFQTAKFPDPELQNTLKKECALVRCSDFGGVTGKRGEQEEYFTSAQEYGQYAPLKLTPKTFNHKFIPFR